jgi:hypothetical protein
MGERRSLERESISQRIKVFGRRVTYEVTARAMKDRIPSLYGNRPFLEVHGVSE